MKKSAIIVPACSDYNRGDQALVLETMNVIKIARQDIEDVYMMSNNETKQCEEFGLKQFQPILKHPSRFTKKSSNIKYGISLKIKWGFIAIFDFILSQLLLNKFTRTICMPFLKKETKESMKIYKDCDVCFVKGGGFMHDYTGGIIGLYTIYYQIYPIILAQKLNKDVYIMPNSYGPFKGKKTAKLLNKVLDKCKYITAREGISANSSTNGLNRNIDLYPDLGFFLEEANLEETKKYLNDNYQLDITSGKYVAITVRPYRFYNYDNPEEKYINYKKVFVKFINLLNEKGYKPLLVVHTRAENDHENDECCINEIAQMINDSSKYTIIKDDSLNCKQIKSIYSFCDFVIGTRFHSVIFSMEKLIPVIAITYGGNKGDGIMKDIGIDNYAIKIGDLTYEILKEKFIELEQNKQDVTEKIKNYLEYSKTKYKELIDKIK